MRKINKISALAMSALMLSYNFAFAQNYNYVQSPKNVQLNNSYSGYMPSNAIQADIQSQRIPAGTHLRVRMETPINTFNSKRGTPFISTITEDIRVSNNIVLPSGTSIRGRIGRIVNNTRLSRGAEMFMVFDHVTTPVGRQIPVVARISSIKEYKVTEDGSVSAGGGYLKAVNENLDQGVGIAAKASMFGLNTGLSLYDKINDSSKSPNPWAKAGVAVVGAIPVVLITPVAAAGGFAVGSTVFFTKSVMAMIKKGDIVKIDPGDLFEVTLLDPVDIPVN
ncbi:MAG: hypothetical protein A2287_07980 [Candidatus Melainabacteria bacterium RIFOXYA12_FULL_32_12]|nr:MAG: hypothetical protein A2255_08900 [Candidatus Melainabacteria bacterium RIFOXYA2_FULL_32_9]OGI25925.1 MAG: hypothetical protein A2287_07980 [Candidatus Melainabacteria bacterium RIFOXYA12_FULL_32_12]